MTLAGGKQVTRILSLSLTGCRQNQSAMIRKRGGPNESLRWPEDYQHKLTAITERIGDERRFKSGGRGSQPAYCEEK
jgi:hypothetical protein